ncbi:hypothetical protein AERO9AM_20996 [Aeromicrobium sp. 9AM]|nr:hypothetical protein AERO9AM_20996 [Aeromicrobium sp. 9AM]
MPELDRIGEIPPCSYPGCPLDGVTLAYARYPGVGVPVCSLHVTWRPPLAE